MWDYLKVFGFKVDRVGEIRWRSNPDIVESLKNRFLNVEECVMDNFFLWKVVEDDH